MKPLGILAAMVALTLTSAAVAQDKAAVLKELTPTGKLRVGVAVAPVPGAGNVAMDPPRGVAIELGEDMARKLGVPVEFVRYPNSGAVTDAADSNAWDVAFLPVDATRKKKVAFGAAHIVLQSTFLVGPGSTIRTLADVDRPGVRVVGVENTATSRAAAASLKAVTMTNVKTGRELFEMLQSGKADAIAQSRESLTTLAAKLPGSRVLEGAFLNSYVAVAVPRNKPAALAHVSAYVEEAKAAGGVRRALDNIGLKSSTVAPAGAVP